MLGGKFFFLAKKLMIMLILLNMTKFFAKTHFSKKSVFSLFHTMLLFLCEVCCSFLSLDVKSLEKKKLGLGDFFGLI